MSNAEGGMRNDLVPNAIPHAAFDIPHLGAALPFVSVIMPVRDEADFIARSLGAVLAQDYPAACREVLVVDGMSGDGTRDIVRALQADHPQVHLLDNPRQIAPTALNIGLAHARG